MALGLYFGVRAQDRVVSSQAHVVPTTLLGYGRRGIVLLSPGGTPDCSVVHALPEKMQMWQMHRPINDDDDESPLFKRQARAV